MNVQSLKKVLSLGLGLAALSSLVFVSVGHAAKGIVKGCGGGACPNFKVEMDGVAIGGVLSVTGIKTEMEVIEYRDGDDMSIRKRPGRVKYGDITLKRGFTENNDWWLWYQEIMKGQNIRKSISIIITKNDGSEAGRYNYLEAFPCRWEGPALSSIGDPDFDLLRVSIGDPDFDLLRMAESITFCTERMDRK